MTAPETDERRVERLLAPLQDIPPVPYRDRRPATGQRWLRPALVTVAGLAVVIAVGAAIVTSGSGTGSQPAATTPPAPTVSDAPAPTTTGSTTAPATNAGAAWFLQDGKLVRIGTPDTSGRDATGRALELLLGGPRSALMATGTSGGGFTTAVPADTLLETGPIADTIATIGVHPRPTGKALEQIVRTVTDTGPRWVRLVGDPALLDATIAAGQPDAAPPIELVRAQSDGSKVRFAGTADTFEANVQLRLMQGDKQLAQTFVTATCGTGCRGSFDGTIAVPVGASADPLRLEAYTLSAEDGSERDVVKLPVTGG